MGLMQRLGKNSAITIALVALVLARAVDQTLYYRLVDTYANYVWYLGALILPVAFLAISWPVVLYKLYFTKDITPEMRACPEKKFIIMGALDTAFNLLSSWPVNGVGSTTALVVSQLVLPINMVFSYCFIGTRYSRAHYLGAVLVIYGLLVQQIPVLQGGSGGGDSKGLAYVGWFAMMVASNLPNAGSNVYKEIALKDIQLDVWYANAKIATWQLAWGLLTAPTVALPFQPDRVALSELPSYAKHATSCFFGNNAVATDDCRVEGLPIVIFLFFIVFNITYNQLMLTVFRDGSSVLFVVASAVRLPLVQIFLMWKFVAGGAKASFSLHDGFALFMLVLALLIYNSEPELKSAPASRLLSTSSSSSSSAQHPRSYSALLTGDALLAGESPRVGTELPTSRDVRGSDAARLLSDSEAADMVLDGGRLDSVDSDATRV